MKKVFLIFLMIFLIAPASLAEITITTDQPVYNLGNKIKASASVVQSNDFEGLFKLTISCENYKLDYFLTPLSLESNFRSAVSVPEVTVKPSMLGNCVITGDLVTNDNLIIEEKVSERFSVTNHLAVLPVNSKIVSLPSQQIQIASVVNEAFGNNVLKASADVKLDNNSYTIEIVDGKLNLSLQLPSNIKSGKHTIEIRASDQKNNMGESSIELEVTAVPSYITLELSGNSLDPGSKVEIISSLYDQADDLINATLELELTGPRGNKVFNKVVQSNEKIDYEFSQYAEPGTYILASVYKALSAKALINITTIREVKVKYGNETVLIENIGNVPFEEELTFILQSKLNKYPITKKINVEPGKLLSVDLSKEVPLGVYDVTLPIKEGLEPIKQETQEIVENIVESAQESISNLLPEKESVLATDVTIHDNRPIYKRITGALASISSALVGAEGIATKNPLVAPTILVIIVLLLVIRYGGKPIMRLLKRKKSDGTIDKENVEKKQN